MHPRCTGSRLFGAAFILASMATAPPALASSAPGRWQVIEGGRSGQNRGAYNRGYREGLRQGERDGRTRRDANARRHQIFQHADLGYSREYGGRGPYQTAFRGGFIDGYRVGFDRAIGSANRRSGGYDRRGSPGFLDAATARGYSDGFERGADDGRDHDRYDPVTHRDYRDADDGYDRRYGPREAYRNQYRAGFRQGYEDGYRNGIGRR